MSSTSVHLPAGLLRQLDRVAKRRRLSRNRLIVEACRSLVGQGRVAWPDDFFASDRLGARDLELLRTTYDDWMDRIAAARRSKKSPPF